MVRWSWVNFQCRGVLLVWIRVGQGPTALAVGAGGGCLDIFTLFYPFSPLSPSLWETTRYRLKYCLKGSLSPKSTNQPSPTSPCCTTCRVTMPHSEALFEKSCLRCHPTHSYHRMGSSGVEQLFNPPRDIPVSICQSVHPIFCDPALGIKGLERHLVQMLPVDAMAL